MLAAVRDLREHRVPASPEELEQFEVDVLAGFVLARASSGVTDATIRGEVGHLEHVRTWFERALWEMEPSDADRYFGEVLRHSSSGTRQAKSLALRTYFEFMEWRHQAEIAGGELVAFDSGHLVLHESTDRAVALIRERCRVHQESPPAEGSSRP